MDTSLLQKQISTHFELADIFYHEEVHHKEVQLSEHATKIDLPWYLKEEYAKKHKKDHANVFKVDPESRSSTRFYIEDAYIFCVVFPEYIEIYLNDEIEVLFDKSIVNELIEDMGATLKNNLKRFSKELFRIYRFSMAG